MSPLLSRRDFLRLSLGTGAVAALAGFPNVIRAQDTTVLTVWTFSGGRAEWMEAVFTELYAGEYTDVELDIQVIPWGEIWDRLQTVFVSGTNVPDIVDIEVSQWTRYVRGTVPFLPLNERIGDRMDLLTTSAATIPWTLRDGNIYGISNEINPVILAYRKDLLSEAGLLEVVQEATLWSEMVENVGMPLRDRDLRLMVIDVEGDASFYRDLTQRGGQYFDSSGDPAITSNLAIQTLSWHQQRLHQDEVMLAAPTVEAQYSPYSNNEVVLYAAPPWALANLKRNLPDQAGQWGVRPLPLWEDGGYRATPLGGTAMGITTSCEHPDEAWAFIEVCNLTQQGAELSFQINSNFPTYMPLQNDERLLVPDPYFDDQAIAAVIREVANDMPDVNQGPNWAALKDSLQRIAIPGVMLEQRDPEEALREALEDYEFSIG